MCEIPSDYLDSSLESPEWMSQFNNVYYMKCYGNKTDNWLRSKVLCSKNEWDKKATPTWDTKLLRVSEYESPEWMGQHRMWNTKNGNYGFTITITEIQTFE